MSTTAPTKPAAAPAAKSNGKGKLAIYWAASCGGCEISILGIDDKILDVAKAFDLVMCPCIADGKVSDIEKMADGEIDVCLFNGGIRTSEQEYMAQLFRKKSKVLVAFGSCATEGCIPGLGNLHNRKAIFDNTYQETFSTENPNQVRPQAETQVPEGDAAPARVLRHAEDAGPDGQGRLLPAGLPAGIAADLGGDRGDRQRQLAAAGHGDRRPHDGLRFLPADAHREEDQGIQADLGGHSGRDDVPAGTGPAVLRPRHAGRLRCLVPAGQLAVHRLLRPERRTWKTTGPGC